MRMKMSEKIDDALMEDDIDSDEECYDDDDVIHASEDEVGGLREACNSHSFADIIKRRSTVPTLWSYCRGVQRKGETGVCMNHVNHDRFICGVAATTSTVCQLRFAILRNK